MAPFLDLHVNNGIIHSEKHLQVCCFRSIFARTWLTVSLLPVAFEIVQAILLCPRCGHPPFLPYRILSTDVADNDHLSIIPQGAN